MVEKKQSIREKQLAELNVLVNKHPGELTAKEQEALKALKVKYAR